MGGGRKGGSRFFKKRVCSCPRPGPPPSLRPPARPLRVPGRTVRMEPISGGPRLHAYGMRAPYPENLAYWGLSFPAFRRTFPMKYRLSSS